MHNSVTLEGVKMRNVTVPICFLAMATIAMAQDAQQGSITGFGLRSIPGGGPEYRRYGY
jgi:hypothetical protein